MAFRKLPTGIDRSDMELWAKNRCATVFMEELGVLRDNALRALIKRPTEEDAAIVRAYDRVSALREEAKNLK